MDYKSKYIKYKKKYTILKEQLGGKNNITVNFQNREYNNNFNKSFNLISNYLNKNPNGHLNWELWNNVKSQSPSEYDRKDSSIYQKEEYKLFSMEDFLNSKWSFLSNLIRQYENQYNNSKWYGNKPSEEQLNDKNTYPVIVQKLIVNDRSSKFCIIGDVHSSLHSLLSVFSSIKNDYFENTEEMILKNNRYIIFLGDIMDRGPYNMEVLFLALSLKNKNFNNVILIDGNHEDLNLFEKFDTVKEFNLQFNDMSKKVKFEDTLINKIFNRTCTCLYLFTPDKRYHLSHGSFDSFYAGFKNGIEIPEEKDFHKETNLYKFLESNSTLCMLDSNNSSTNYKWGDFNNEIKDTRVSSRGSGIFEYSYNLTKEYLNRYKITNIFSGHQDYEPINFLIDKNNNVNNFVKSERYPLYQPKDLQTFSLSDKDFAALTTSTATVTRNFDYQGIYIELTIN